MAHFENTYFINTPYRLTINVKGSQSNPAPNLSTASSVTIEYEGPGNISGSWPAVAVYNPAGKVSTVLYEIGASTITQVGTYKFQVVAVINSVTRRSGIGEAKFIETL